MRDVLRIQDDQGTMEILRMLGDLVPGSLQVERTIRRVTRLSVGSVSTCNCQWSTTVYKNVFHTYWRIYSMTS